MLPSIPLSPNDAPMIMGILNATPDSFYTKQKYTNMNSLCDLACQMHEEGAEILDIGGMSSRPNATIISEQEEIDRVLPLVEAIKKAIPQQKLSIDTYRSKVAEICLQHGVSIINDISGGKLDEAMLYVVAKWHATFVCMHMQGTPQTMQIQPMYNDVVEDIDAFFSERLETLKKFGISNVILDPGFGFGKTVQHNYTLLSQLNYFLHFKKPILVGISRKSMVYKPLHGTADHSLNGTTALHMIALQKGAKILRVHDVKEAKECILLHNLLLENKNNHL